MPKWRRATLAMRSVAKTLIAVVWAYAWMVPMVAALQMPPAVAAVLMLVTIGAFVGRNVVRPLRARPRLVAQLRLRPFTRYLPLLTLAVAAKLVLVFSSFLLHEEMAARRILPRLPDEPEIVSRAFMAHPLGAVAVVLAIAVLAPLIEEFAFRGKMQYELEHAIGIRTAIIVPALLFSALHGLADAIHHLPYGLFVGWLVWRTGSIWGAVYMHALNNSVAAAALLLSEDSPGAPDMPADLWPYAIIAGVVALGALLATGRRIHRLANRTRPRASGWPLAASKTSRPAAAV
jgi:membrane protease YdiL (CAAX protease family)